MKPTLSIIVPCYNVQNYVATALQSIVQNTQPENQNRVEIIIVNDGSTDQTAAAINTQLSGCPIAAHVITQENAGLSAARNTGMAQAQGNYWLFLDSDDFYQNQAIDKILAVIDAHQPDIIEFDATIFYGENDWAEQTLYHSYFADIANPMQPENSKIQRTFQENRWYVWSRCYHKKLFQNQTFERSKLYEDFMTIPYLYPQAQSIFRLPESLLAYRQNHSSITANVSHRHIADIFYGLQKAIAAETTQPQYRELWQILQLKTWRLIVAYSVKRFLRTRKTAYLANVQRFRAQLRQQNQRNWGWQFGYFGSVLAKRLFKLR
ncbi:glycosyltransferase family 2 protein [Kingella negevensis]|uniref:glycosyltransferase family 2 protein n=1 Tax=Kingella negevensis TaxID=1522312 RepID=UPI000A268F54|nr:glycosyltransferase family 2 protein [Kingella negevensis]MDK4688070.1 glycosyltransferase family 2 protein [Kingella negevensis]WII90946.1 glycosyltransferase family 2 protein [Kingella negevensis]